MANIGVTSVGKVYFGFAIRDTMFRYERKYDITRYPLTVEQAKRLIKLAIEREAFVPVLDLSHKALISALNYKLKLNIPVPEVAPQVLLQAGDQFVIMQYRGLPPLEDRSRYSKKEIEKADFFFSLWEIETEIFRIGKQELFESKERKRRRLENEEKNYGQSFESPARAVV